jgi:hypothetical protein
MSKLAATTVSSPRRSLGWLRAALSVLILLPPVAALAAPSDPALRSSEQVDIRRLGKVSDDERAVLRVEWRAAVTGADEARAVQDMLDSLRRMQGTIGDISRLIRGIPAQKPVAEAVAIEPAESGPDEKMMALAGSAAAGLLAMWWSRRRESAKHSAAVSRTASAEASPPVFAPAVNALPAATAPTGTAPAEAPAAVAPVAEPRNEAPRLEPAAGANTPPPAPAPQSSGAPKVAQAVPPAPEQSISSALPDTAAVPAMEFTLEEADPESIARADARLRKLQTARALKPPSKVQETSVEPTLELAEIMLSLGLEQGAAQTLLEYTEANPRQALHHWLKLLDIYRSSGHIEDFKETAEKLRRNFNIQAEDWAKASAAEAPTLENFGRLSEHVQNAWMRPEECISYLRNLLEDNREGARAGFPRAVAEEILLLIEILQETSGVGQTAGG